MTELTGICDETAAATGAPQAWLVTTGEYDDYQVVMACADERRARHRRLYAQVEAVPFVR